jgi:hypothetical protein
MTSSPPRNGDLSAANFQDADAYDRLMGRWSRRLAPLLIGFGGLADAWVRGHETHALNLRSESVVYRRRIPRVCL